MFVAMPPIRPISLVSLLASNADCQCGRSEAPKWIIVAVCLLLIGEAGRRSSHYCETAGGSRGAEPATRSDWLCLVKSCSQSRIDWEGRSSTFDLRSSGNLGFS